MSVASLSCRWGAMHAISHCWGCQVVEDAKVRLRGEILSKLEQAKKQGDHRTVLRFTRLYAPLGLQVRAPEAPMW